MKAFYVFFFFTAAMCVNAQMDSSRVPPTPLTALVEEAQQNNPEVQAAMHSAQAAGHAAKQAGALLDTPTAISPTSAWARRRNFPGRESAHCGLRLRELRPTRCARNRARSAA